jgi:4-diphosphocytidyl-2-C-methyl-D-erythritol kinase
LNLGLKVFPPRPDGFHELESWMVPLSWHDTLLLTPDRPLELKILGRSEGIPADVQKNLVGRAALRLAREAGIQPSGLIELHKVVPPGGGLGGGSSDAAAALVALNQIWQTNLPQRTLTKLAAELGSDVAFFVDCEPAFCTGRGEMLQPMPAYNALFAVLLLPPQGLATKPVYESLDRGNRHPVESTFDWRAWARLAADELNDVLANDLEPAAFYIAPWLADLRQKASAAIGQKVHMTGSGSTLFTLCGSSARASTLKQCLLDNFGPSCACVTARILRQRYGPS